RYDVRFSRIELRKSGNLMFSLRPGGEQNRIGAAKAAPFPCAIATALLNEFEWAFCPFVTVVQHERNAETARYEERRHEREEPRAGGQHRIRRIVRHRLDGGVRVEKCVLEAAVDSRKDPVGWFTRGCRHDVDRGLGRNAREQLFAVLPLCGWRLTGERVDAPPPPAAVADERERSIDAHVAARRERPGEEREMASGARSRRATQPRPLQAQPLRAHHGAIDERREARHCAMRGAAMLRGARTQARGARRAHACRALCEIQGDVHISLHSRVVADGDDTRTALMLVVPAAEVADMVADLVDTRRQVEPEAPLDRSGLAIAQAEWMAAHARISRVHHRLVAASDEETRSELAVG